MNFEEKMQRVQDIIATLNRGDISLERLVSLYDEAKLHLKESSEELEDARLRITEHEKKDGDG